MGPLGYMPQVIFCALLCIFTNNIQVSVKNSSAEGTCLIQNDRIKRMHLFMM